MANLPDWSDGPGARERAEFIAGILRRLFAMREDNNSQGIDFVSALHRELGLASRATARVQTAKPDQIAADSGVRRPLLGSIGQMFTTANRMLRTVSGKTSILLVGIDPLRVCWLHRADFLGTVQSHLHPDLDRVHEWLAKPAQDASCAVVGFEPKNAIRQLEDIRHVANDISNPFSIILAGLLRFPSWSPGLIFFITKFFWRELEAQTTSQFSRVKATVALCLFVMGCDVLLRKASEIRMLCLTSNSIFLELLRSMVLERQGGDVIEILHGMPTPSFDEYLIDLGRVSANWRGTPIQLYPLLPAPLCRPKVKLEGICWNDTASNTGMLKALNFICDKELSPKELRSYEFLERLSQKICFLQRLFLRDGDPVFSIFGGRDHDDDYYAGQTFQVELEVASLVQDALRQRYREPSIIYLPHPSNRPLKHLFLPSGEEIHVFGFSQLAYFVTDFGFSLYSSSMFEASFLGAHCFTPLLDDNSLFDRQLMSHVYNTKNLGHGSLLAAISRFADLEIVGMQDHKQKVTQRMTKMFLESDDA